MDRHPATRLIVDAGFACAIAVAIVLAIRSRSDVIPVMPDGFVATTAVDDQPRVPDRVAIAAVFAEIHGARDFTGWTIRTFERELGDRGFLRTSSGRFERRDATVDVIVLPDERAVVERALNHVLVTHAVVYYNGHNFGGDLALAAPLAEASDARRLYERAADSRVPYVRPPPEPTELEVDRVLTPIADTSGARRTNELTRLSAVSLVRPPRESADGRASPIVVLDTCYSAQHYGELGARVTLVANTERAITGSIYSFLSLLDGLLARDGRSWNALLAAMNAAAVERATARSSSRYPEPEGYALVRRR